MKKLLPMLFIAALTAGVAAQEPTASKELTLETTSYAYAILPLSTTVNNNIIVFYDHREGNTTSLKSRMIKPNGKTLPSKVISSNILGLGKSATRMLHLWNVAWHPQAKRFMTAYRRLGTMHVRAANSKGKKLGSERDIGFYSKEPLLIAWTKKKRFLLAYENDGQIEARLLNRDGKKLKSPKILASAANGKVVPVDCATEKDGTVAIYYFEYDSKKKKIRPGVLRVNHKLELVGSFFVDTLNSDRTQDAEYMKGTYDPTSNTHSLAWHFGGDDGTTWCNVKPSGTIIQPPTTDDLYLYTKDLIVDPVNNVFCIFFTDYRTATLYHFLMYTYKPDGTVVQRFWKFKETNDNSSAHGAGYSRNGNLFLGWVNLNSDGIYGHLLY